MGVRRNDRGLRHHPGVAGVDEAGRAPLAGPVVAAAVILPRGFPIDGLDDSKKLTSNERDELGAAIKKGAAWGVGSANHLEIDRLNILWATMLAMERAVEALGAHTRILIDGNRLPRGLVGRAEYVIGGDAKFACIAAASIIAKTTRDSIMVELAEQYSGYGFENHFGYSTPEHLAALEQLGPCPIHRRSFARCRVDDQLCLALAD